MKLKELLELQQNRPEELNEDISILILTLCGLVYTLGIKTTASLIAMMSVGLISLSAVSEHLKSKDIDGLKSEIAELQKKETLTFQEKAFIDHQNVAIKYLQRGEFANVAKLVN